MTHFVDFEGVKVDVSLVNPETWEGCAWVFPDGSALAVQYGHHDYGAQHHSGGNDSCEKFSQEYSAVHVGGWVSAVKRPTQAQKNTIVALSAKSGVKLCLDYQEWQVYDWKDNPRWAL